MQKTDVDYAVFNGEPLTKEALTKAVVKEIEASHALLDTLLSEPEALQAVADVYWKRYTEIMERKKASQPELPLDA